MPRKQNQRWTTASFGCSLPTNDLPTLLWQGAVPYFGICPSCQHPMLHYGFAQYCLNTACRYAISANDYERSLL